MALLEERFRAFRLALLTAMSLLTHETPQEEVSRVTGMWKRLRTEAAKVQLEPMEARLWFKAEIWPTPQWRNFDRVRNKRWRSRPTFKKAAAAKARTRRAAQTPEQKAAEATRKKREYHAKKGGGE